MERQGIRVPATHYKVAAKGGPVGKGVTGSVFVSVHGIAKSGSTQYPTLVANELVCSRLASALLLPVPPGFLIKLENVLNFVSLDFNLAGQSLPPADGSAVVQAFPELSWGIILFDMWVLNGDRHNGNLSYDTVANKVQLFDHSHALFAHGNFQNVATATAIGGHCLAAEMTSLDGLKEWHSHILALPERFVRSVVGDVAADEFGVTTAGAQECADFLIARRVNLINIAKANAGTFPKVPAAKWSGDLP